MTILVTGGAGFIGANFVASWIERVGSKVVNLDKLTYAGSLSNLSSLQGEHRHHFVRGDIGDTELVSTLLRRHLPRAIVNFAAETHVDRSIKSPAPFVETNIVGTFSLLEAALQYWQSLPASSKHRFRFIHVSTDEVYGSLAPDDPPCIESTAYCPTNPYSASKAAADHLVRSFNRTYGLPIIVTHSCNNYGRYQFPEKLVPLIIARALRGQYIPVYGDGENIRDWLFVEEHCEAIRLVLEHGVVGESYNIGGGNPLTNNAMVARVCDALDRLRPRESGRYTDLISHVADRKGHDRRYSMDCSRLRQLTGWRAKMSIDDGLERTVGWYLEQQRTVD